MCHLLTPQTWETKSQVSSDHSNLQNKNTFMLRNALISALSYSTILWDVTDNVTGMQLIPDNHMFNDKLLSYAYLQPGNSIEFL